MWEVERMLQDGAREGLMGTLTLNVTVAADGTVIRRTIVKSSGNVELDALGARAAEAMKITPARIDGFNIEATMVVPLRIRR